jgi:hypothetical protein
VAQSDGGWPKLHFTLCLQGFRNTPHLVGRELLVARHPHGTALAKEVRQRSLFMTRRDPLPPKAATPIRIAGRIVPDFFIVGAPKCGTTAMVKYLDAHPDIFMARKETHVFGQDLKFSPRIYRRDPQAYLAEFNAWNGEQRVGEGSVWYLFSNAAAAEIKAFNPHASIIMMLREPADMLYSLYHQFVFDGNEHLQTFEAALAAENDRRAGRKVARHSYLAQALLYRDTARFSEQVERYFRVFGRERVHVIIYDDFAADPEGAYEEALEFLDLTPAPVANGFGVVNGSDKTVRLAALRRLLVEPRLRAGAIALAGRLPKPVFRIFQSAESYLWRYNTRPAKRAPLAPELRARLRQEFAPEVERLSALLGRDLTHWTTGQRPGGQPVQAPAAALAQTMPRQIVKDDKPAVSQPGNRGVQPEPVPV